MPSTASSAPCRTLSHQQNVQAAGRCWSRPNPVVNSHPTGQEIRIYGPSPRPVTGRGHLSTSRDQERRASGRDWPDATCVRRYLAGYPLPADHFWSTQSNPNNTLKVLGSREIYRIRVGVYQGVGRQLVSTICMMKSPAPQVPFGWTSAS